MGRACLLKEQNRPLQSPQYEELTVPAFQSGDFIEVRALYWLGCFAFLTYRLNPNICLWDLIFVLHPKINLFSLLFHDCNFASVMNHNVFLELEVFKGIHIPQVENHCSRGTELIT